MAGIGIQQLFIIIFFMFALSFHRTMNREGDKPKMAFALLYTVYLALLCITVCLNFFLLFFVNISFPLTRDLFRFASSSAFVNMPKGQRAPRSPTKSTNTCLTPFRCSSLWFRSISSTPAPSCLVKLATSPVAKNGGMGC